MLVLLRRMFELRSDSNLERAIADIRVGVDVRGGTLWILICAALIASLGLDTSSVAVIIGAMLISPLMSPILGIGVGVGIHEKDLLLKALRNFGLATLVSLVAATLYFLVTPLGDVTREMLSRTRPTLLDVAIAFFGGLAGIIAQSRQTQTLVLPGVAIATALMPPLCTAGFGIATGRWTFFLGAFYLFFINAVFIATATYLTVRVLHVPHTLYVNPVAKRKVEKIIAAFLVAVIIPGAVIFVDVIRDTRMQQRAEQFVNRYLVQSGRDVLRWEIIEGSPPTLKVYATGDPVSQQQVDGLRKSLARMGMDQVQLRIVSLEIPDGSEGTLTPEEILDLIETGVVRSIQKASATSQTARPDSLPMTRIEREVRAVFPEIAAIRLLSGPTQIDSTDATRYGATFLLEFRSQTPSNGALQSRLRGYLRERTDLDTLVFAQTLP